jgi:hypothetical protein
MTYRNAVWAGYHERSVGARIGTLAGVVTLPLLSLASWLLSLPTELQTILWAAFAVVTWIVGLDIGRAAWKKARTELDQVQRDLAAERRYKTALGVELEALGQRLYKRTTEWWVASLAGNRPEADQKRAEAEVVMREINDKLHAEVSEPDAGYFRRPRAYEPFRPNMAGLPDGNWINEMWHRVNRLDEIIERMRYGRRRA